MVPPLHEAMLITVKYSWTTNGLSDFGDGDGDVSSGFCFFVVRTVVISPPSNIVARSLFSKLLCSWYSWAVTILLHLPA